MKSGFSLAVFLWAVCAGCITDRVLVARDQADGSVVYDVDAAVVEQAKKKTTQLRHLPFLRDVPIDVLTVPQLEEWLNRYYDDYKVALKRQDYFYHKMGILPPARDTASTWKGFLGGFAGGVYDDDRVGKDGNKGTMILVQDYAWWSKVQLDAIGVITGVDLAYEVFLAHELTHALQDQHFHLDELLDDVGNDDVRMVQKTVLESEANVIGMAHFAGMDLDTFADRKAFFGFLRYNNLFNAPILTAVSGKTPSFFSRQTFAQYELGLSWVEARLDDGEWQRFVKGKGEGASAELALAYARVPGTPGALPASTEQLLFSDKALDPPLVLPRLVLDEERRWAPLPGAVRSSGDVFGALALKHWLERPFAGADDVARGWGGDRYDVFVDDDDSPILLWRLLGDTDDDASEIAAALTARIARSVGEDRFIVDEGGSADRVLARVTPAADERRLVRTTRPERVLVERRGRQVVVVNGVDDEVDLPALVEALFAETVTAHNDDEDGAARARRSADLLLNLEKSFAALPARAESWVGDRLLLPARTMAFRVGVARFAFDDPAKDNDEADFIIGDIEARWGVRENLELSLPGGVTLHSARRAGPFHLAIGLAPGALPFLDPWSGTWSGRVVTTASWEAPSLALQLQAEARPRFAVAQVFDPGIETGAAFMNGDDDVIFTVGLSLRPLPQLVVAPSIAFEDVGSDGGFDADVVRIGGVVQRGFVDAPLVELEVVPGLMAYWASSWGCRVDGQRFKGLTLVEQRQAVGLLLYF